MAMEHANKRFNHAEELLLKQMKGSSCYYRCSSGGSSRQQLENIVRLHFEGFDIDVGTS